MPSASPTLCLKSCCEVAPLSLAVCPHATIAPQIWALKWWHKWRIPHLTPRDRSVRECRCTKCFTQNVPSGHVYKMHRHTHIWARDPAARALTVHRCKCFIAESGKTAMSRRLLLLSICYLTELCTLSLFSCTAQQGTPVSGPDLSLPCSQSSTCPASDALVARLWLWLLPHPSPQDWQLCPRDFLYSWFLCCWCSFWPHGVTIGVPVS